MPTILTINGYRFFFFSNEGQEPVHIHVEKAEGYAKFWIKPVSLARTRGFKARQLAELHKLVEEHKGTFEERWNEFFSG
ncbi:MAG: DUF4160 domain-containing protein [Magnetococcales bacterium]|nr:DUF4160 domain-containing protein [Magnetococcales bacterium]